MGRMTGKKTYDGKIEVSLDETATACDFDCRVQNFIRRVYPDEFDPDLLDPHQLQMERYEDIFSWLDDVYAHRERYNLHWALREAGDVLERLVGESGENIADCLSRHYNRENRERLSRLTARMDRAVKRKQAVINRKTRQFTILSFLVSLVDIVISVILIVIISEIAHFGNMLFTSIILVIIFTAIIALLKVTLDRFYIIPLVQRWGWRKFLENTRINKQTMIEFEAVSIVVMQAIKEEREPRIVCQLIERGIREIALPYTPREIPPVGI